MTGSVDSAPPPYILCHNLHVHTCRGQCVLCVSIYIYIRKYACIRMDTKLNNNNRRRYVESTVLGQHRYDEMQSEWQRETEREGGSVGGGGWGGRGSEWAEKRKREKSLLAFYTANCLREWCMHTYWELRIVHNALAHTLKHTHTHAHIHKYTRWIIKFPSYLRLL